MTAQSPALVFRRSGLPVVRPLVLEYQDDPVAATVDYEYLLGPNILVVPVTNPDGAPWHFNRASRGRRLPM